MSADCPTAGCRPAGGAAPRASTMRITRGVMRRMKRRLSLLRENFGFVVLLFCLGLMLAARTGTRPKAPAPPAAPPPPLLRARAAAQGEGAATGAAAGGGPSPFSGFVYSYWPHHSFAFSQVAYGNLETLLSLMPRAKHRYFVFGPIQHMNYRIGDALSAVQFMRYEKLGYDIRMRVVNENWGPYVKANRWQRRRVPEKQNVGEKLDAARRHGEAWWLAQLPRFPYMAKRLGDIREAHAHPRDVFFMTAAHLYLTGGFFHDFSFAFQAPPPAATPGPAATLLGDGACAAEPAPAVDGWHAALPMLLWFPEPFDASLACILRKYDASLGGAAGLRPAERACLSAGPSRPFYGAAGAAEGRPPPEPEPLPLGDGCAKLLLDSCWEGPRRPVPAAFGACGGGRLLSPLDSNGGPERSEDGTALGGAAEGAAEAQTAFEYPWPPPADAFPPGAAAGAALWTGPGWHGMSWAPVRAGSALQRLHGRRKLLPGPPALAAARRGNGSCAARLSPCQHFSSSFPGGAAPAHAAAQARAKCAPAIVVPGVEKGATTFLFTMLYQHPQLVPPLRGAGFKESAAYTARMKGAAGLWEKVNRFPYIREGEPFVTGDATILNMMDRETPLRVARDQRQPRVVFALREPTSRAWSGYRFSWTVFYKGMVPKFSFPNVVDSGVAGLEGCFDRPGVEGDPAREIEAYYSRCKRGARDPYFTVWKGMYYYAVAHWMRTLGRENVMVVTTEELIRRPEETLASVMNFTGLCAEGVDLAGFASAAHENPTAKRLPKEIGAFGKTEETTRRLNDFYRPHNEKLYRLLGRRLWDDA